MKKKERIERELATRAVMDERLQESEELFRAVFEQHAAVKLLIDPNTGAILDANAAAEKFYSWSRDELRTMRIQQINTLPPEQVKEEMERARKAKKIHFNFRHRRADGSIRDVEVYSSAIKTKNREFLHSIIHDVTEKKILEKQLQYLTASLKEQVEARTAELQKAHQELESFVYTVAHDLRAPVRHISGFLQFLRNELGGTISEKAARFLNNIDDAAKHMSALIDGLLVFARLGKIELRTESFDMKRLVEEILEDFKDDIAHRSVVVNACNLHVIEADRALIRAAMSNLIGNAIKFSRAKEKPEIEITCTPSETEHIISVRDNGVGFDMHYADKLFGIFQRLHGEKEFSGTGIGLASVKQIINRHGGRVWAEGEVGKGTCFYISLPQKNIETTHESFQSNKEPNEQSET